MHGLQSFLVMTKNVRSNFKSLGHIEEKRATVGKKKPPRLPEHRLLGFKNVSFCFFLQQE